MMKVYSVESGKKIRKGITIRKKGEIAEFISFDRKSSRVYISAFYPDLIFSNVVLPPITDSETFAFLLKNRLTGLLEEGKNYSFILFEKKIYQRERFLMMFMLFLKMFSLML
ncbi:MAG: hypothetical protein Q9M89_09690 [Persephonella sp.]|nr:hypothetical protein [Persephonella sp.]